MIQRQLPPDCLYNGALLFWRRYVKPGDRVDQPCDFAGNAAEFLPAFVARARITVETGKHPIILIVRGVRSRLDAFPQKKMFCSSVTVANTNGKPDAVPRSGNGRTHTGSRVKEHCGKCF